MLLHTGYTKAGYSPPPSNSLTPVIDVFKILKTRSDIIVIAEAKPRQLIDVTEVFKISKTPIAGV